MDHVSACPVGEYWDRFARWGLAVADENRQPQSVSLWLWTADARRRRGHARAEGQGQ